MYDLVGYWYNSANDSLAVCMELFHIERGCTSLMYSVFFSSFFSLFFPSVLLASSQYHD
jgi:hypothetical protein